LFGALALARGDDRYARLMRQLARVNPVILDDWGPEPLTADQRRDLLAIVEDRYNCGSQIITSQVPVDRWYEIVGDPTLADAILDRLVHNSHRIALAGKSRRKPEEAERHVSTRLSKRASQDHCNALRNGGRCHAERPQTRRRTGFEQRRTPGAVSNTPPGATSAGRYPPTPPC
jgi:hypothetical protein